MKRRLYVITYVIMLHVLLYLNMFILYNASSDWSIESRDRANKMSCFPGNKHRVSPLRIQSFQRYEKISMSIRY